MHKNRIELEGYLGQKPELRTLPSGMPVAHARLAEDSYRYRDAQGRDQTRTTWHTIVLYGALAQIAATFEQGENVRVVGSLLSRQFTPKEATRPRTVWEIVAREAYVIAPLRREGRPAGAAKRAVDRVAAATAVTTPGAAAAPDGAALASAAVGEGDPLDELGAPLFDDAASFV